MTTRWSIVAVLLLGVAVTGNGQRVRVTGTTAVRWLELRPMVDDSIANDSTTGTGALRETSRGVVAFCAEGAPWCRYRRTADGAIGSLPLMQDLQATAWGFGEGIQAHTHVRLRASAGEAADLWPQGDEVFDLLAAYVDVERSRWRARVGRQWRASGLGVASFDGVAASVRLPGSGDAFAMDAWLGRSLMQGLFEPVSGGAIGAVEELAPDRSGILLGVEARYRPRSGSGLGIAYQRELRADRSWLYSERVSADGSMRVGRSGSVDAAVELDLATGSFNEARVAVQHPILEGLTGVAELRRYRPFFELWTIWGAFTPVGFTEATVAVAWDATEALSLAAEGGWRRYDETGAGVDFLPMKESGWRAGVDAQWRVREKFVATSAWRTDIGFGASRTDLDLGARFERNADSWIGAHLTSFQTAFEFRVGTGRVIGVGIDAGIRLRDDMRVVGDAAVYRHRYGDLAPATDWSQRRMSVRFEWSVGADPGMSMETQGRAP